MAYWGYHLMLDIHGCDQARIQSRQHVSDFCEDLVKKIDMEAIGKPWIEQTAMHLPDKAGFTMVQIIQTSSIVAHFIDESGDIYLDVFSCKKFDTKDVVKCVDEWFKPKVQRENFITRQAGFPSKKEDGI